MLVCFILPYAGVPNPWAVDRFRSVACWEPGSTAGGKRQASKQSFVCHSPSFALPPKPSPPPRSMGKLSSTKLVPGAKEVADHWPYGSLRFSLFFFNLFYSQFFRLDNFFRYIFKFTDFSAPSSLLLNSYRDFFHFKCCALQLHNLILSFSYNLYLLINNLFVDSLLSYFLLVL